MTANGRRVALTLHMRACVDLSCRDLAEATLFLTKLKQLFLVFNQLPLSVVVQVSRMLA
jgi:hypothetical protein